MTYILLRAPSTQEDAGRVETVGHYATREDARAEVNRLTASGYFTPSSFTLVDTLADRVAAAAPDLLAALAEMLADADTMNEPYRNEAICERARAAIAKATGEDTEA